MPRADTIANLFVDLVVAGPRCRQVLFCGVLGRLGRLLNTRKWSIEMVQPITSRLTALLAMYSGVGVSILNLIPSAVRRMNLFGNP